MNIKQLLPTLALAATAAFAQQDNLLGIDKGNMNTKAKPGTDFYEYATGGWQKSSSVDSSSTRAIHNSMPCLIITTKQIRELIEEIASKNHKQGTLEQKNRFSLQTGNG